MLVLGACGGTTIAHSEDTTLASSACSFGIGHYDLRVAMDSLLDEGQTISVDATIANPTGAYSGDASSTLDCDDWTKDGPTTCKRDVETSASGHLVLKEHEEVADGILPDAPQLEIGVTIVNPNGTDQAYAVLDTIDCAAE